MKKGLSRILSLACVFALLLTMAIPAMAADGDDADHPQVLTVSGQYSETQANLVAAKVDALSAALAIKKLNSAGTATEAVKSDITVKASDNKYYKVADVESMGVFVKFDDGKSVKFFPIELTLNVTVNADVSKSTAVIAAKTENDAIVLGTPLTGIQYIGDSMYIFDDYGYLQLGDKDTHEYTVTNEFGDSIVYYIGMQSDATFYKASELLADPTLAAATTVEKDTVTFKDGVFYKADEGGRAVPVEGAVTVEKTKKSAAGDNLNKTNKLLPTELQKEDDTIVYYQVKNEDGTYGPKAGLVEGESKKNEQGNTVKEDNALYEMSQITVGEKKYKVATLVDTSSETGPALVPVTTDVDANGVKSEETQFYIDANKKAQTLGNEGKYPVIDISGSRYAMNEDGSIMKNDLAETWKVKAGQTNENKTWYDAAGTVLGKENIYKIGGKKVDVYKDVELTIDGVTQRYCLDIDNKVLQGAYRRHVAEDGTDLGVSYYNEDGITYAGWVMVGGTGTDKDVLRYQTVGDVYYLVTGLQMIPEGVQPADTSKTIPEGFYLFDKEGKLVTATAVEMYGHKYKLNKDTHIVEEIDGEAPTLENIGE